MSSNNVPTAPFLTGRVIRSERQRGVYYEIERCVGEATVGRAYLARRRSEEGAAPVVLKVLHSPIEGVPVGAVLAVKEAVALGRLNEQVPPCPFVVRLVDAGNTTLYGSTQTPWLAVEYVHGGLEGTTLEQRVRYSLERARHGFHAARAAHLVRCLAAGLTAIHAVSVLHRDLAPGSVLCCGFGENELFKIAEFGVARPLGLAYTWAGRRSGTPGYAAPDADDEGASTAADVFSLAAVLHYALTGEHYFATTPGEPRPSEPRSIAASPTLDPELRERADACRELDIAIARATDPMPSERPASAEEFADLVLPWLGGKTTSPRSNRPLLSAVANTRESRSDRDYVWNVRQRPREDMAVRSAAWDSGAHALALTSNGASFWDGANWRNASQLLDGLGFVPTFATRHEAGGWLLGGSGSGLAVVDTSGVSAMLRGPELSGTFSLASGRLFELFVAVETRDAVPVALWCAAGGRWLEPCVVEDVTRITTLVRLDESRWVFGGRLREGGAFAAVYAPLEGKVEPIAVPPLRSFVGSASDPERGVAMLVGSDGVALRLERTAGKLAVAASVLRDAPDLSAAAIDVLDCEWTTSVGQIFRRDARNGEDFRPQWRDPTWRAPFISVYADVGLVIAMTADGAILEGRASS